MLLGVEETDRQVSFYRGEREYHFPFITFFFSSRDARLSLFISLTLFQYFFPLIAVPAGMGWRGESGGKYVRRKQKGMKGIFVPISTFVESDDLNIFTWIVVVVCSGGGR